MTRTTIRSLLAAVFFLSVSLASSAQAAAPIYTVEAIRYGTIPDFPVAGLVAGADKSRHMDIAMVF
jgi:ABC-type nitrate/sulfonate/bicarbonate transport system substrate-binding protein